MKISEYIQAQLQAIQAQIPNSLVVAELELLGFQDENIAGQNEKAKQVLYNLIPIILASPNSVSEGGYSVSYDKDSLLKYYNLLSKELGLENKLDQLPTVTDITDRW